MPDEEAIAQHAIGESDREGEGRLRALGLG
jgi:hypothetical protein